MILLCTADCLGRFNLDSLSHQSLMELVVDGMAMKGRFYDYDNDFMDISSWNGTSLDEDGNVTELRWWHGSLSWRGGSIDLKFLPSTVEIVQLKSLKMEGTFPNCHLPKALKDFNAANNLLYGGVLLESLPDKLEKLNLESNIFRGSIDLTRLPHNLTVLILGENKFEGSVNLTKLPSSMQTLALNTNQLTGSISINSLPDSVRVLNLQENAFHGDLMIKNLPLSISRMNLESNTITKVMIECQLPNNLTLLLKHNEGLSVLFGNVACSENTATWHIDT